MENKTNELKKETHWDFWTIFWWVLIVIFLIGILKWIWTSGYRSSQFDNMSNSEFNKQYGTPRVQELKE